jgi:hypothetical protein
MYELKNNHNRKFFEQLHGYTLHFELGNYMFGLWCHENLHVLTSSNFSVIYKSTHCKLHVSKFPLVFDHHHQAHEWDPSLPLWWPYNSLVESMNCMNHIETLSKHNLPLIWFLAKMSCEN